jgi:hypothetical protein
MNQERFARIYMWSIVVCGSLISLVSLYQLQFANLDDTIHPAGPVRRSQFFGRSSNSKS